MDDEGGSPPGPDDVSALPVAGSSRGTAQASAAGSKKRAGDPSAVPVAEPSLSKETTKDSASAPKKRSRAVHEAWEALGACDGCRLRRVKCRREDPFDPTCESCAKKQLVCTQLRNGGLRYKPRSGTRIQAAAAAFGVKSSSSNVKPNSSLAPPRHRIPMGPNESSFMRANLEGTLVHHLSERSTENMLSVSELSESMLSNLVDQYFDFATFAVPLAAWNNLQRRFERAGRRLQQLDVLTEALVLACVTFAAMSSDNPAIVGPNAPRLAQIQNLGSSANYSQYSKRRQEFCRPLIDRVADMVEQRGCFRVASPETVSLLGMTADLIGYPSGRNSFELGRPFWVTQAGHIRHMADTRDPGNDISTGTDWFLGLKDGFRSMTDGPSLIMTEDDIRDFFLVFKPKPVTPDMYLEAIFSPSVQVFGPPIASSWYALIDVTRSAAKTISIPFARNEQVPIANFLTELRKASELFITALEAEGRVRAIASTIPAHVILEQRRIAGSSLLDHADAFPLAVAVYFLPFAHQWRMWKHRNQAFREIGVMEKTVDSETSKLEEIEQLLKERMVDAILLMARALEERRNGRAMELVTHLNPFSFTRFHLDKWALLAAKIPCAEAGGPAKFTARRQLASIKTFIDGLRTQSWTWPSMQDSAEICEAALRKLKAKMASLKFDTDPPEAIAAPSPARSSVSNSSNRLGASSSNGVPPNLSTEASSSGLPPTPLYQKNGAEDPGSSHTTTPSSSEGGGGYSLDLYRRHHQAQVEMGTVVDQQPLQPHPDAPRLYRSTEDEPQPEPPNPYHHFASNTVNGRYLPMEPAPVVNGRYAQPAPPPPPPPPAPAQAPMPVAGVSNPLLSFPLGGLPAEMTWGQNDDPQSSTTASWVSHAPLSHSAWGFAESPFAGHLGTSADNFNQQMMPATGSMAVPHMSQTDWERILAEAERRPL